MENRLWNSMNRRQKTLYIIMASSPLPLALFIVSLHVRFVELYLLGVLGMAVAGCLYRKRKFGW